MKQLRNFSIWSLAKKFSLQFVDLFILAKCTSRSERNFLLLCVNTKNRQNAALQNNRAKKHSIKFSPAKAAGHRLTLHIQNTLFVLMRLFGSEFHSGVSILSHRGNEEMVKSVRAEIENKSKRWWVRFWLNFVREN